MSFGETGGIGVQAIGFGTAGCRTTPPLPPPMSTNKICHRAGAVRGNDWLPELLPNGSFVCRKVLFELLQVSLQSRHDGRILFCQIACFSDVVSQIE